MNILLSVEATLKNSLSYRFCGRYCTSIFNTEEYINPNNFVRPQQRALLQKWNRFWPFSNHRDYIASLKRKYNYMDVYDKLPFWVAIKGIDFGTTAQYIRFLDRTTKAEVKNDLGFQNFSENTFEHAIYMLKEMRNRTSVNYMDIIKILKLLVSKKEIQKVKRCIIRFYIKYVFKRKTWMVKKILGKMGNQNIKKWIKL